MAELIPSLIAYSIPVLLLLLGFFVGRWVEKRHYRSIHEREAYWLNIPTTDTRHVPEPERVELSMLVSANVSVSVDYFKRFLASLRMIFGGEVKSYSPLLDRARREAMLRMKEQCPDADMFVNCRYETATIYSGQKNTTACVEVLAYGTAIRYRK